MRVTHLCKQMEVHILMIDGTKTHAQDMEKKHLTLHCMRCKCVLSKKYVGKEEIPSKRSVLKSYITIRR